MGQTVFTLKTPFDSLCYLCQLESRMLSLRAFHRQVITDKAGINDPESQAFCDMESVVGDFVDIGTDVGHLLGFIREGEAPPLTANGRAVLDDIAAAAKDIFPHNWDKEVRNGISDVALSRWEYEHGSPGYEGTFTGAFREECC